MVIATSPAPRTVVLAEIAPRFSRIETLRDALRSMATRDSRRVATYIPGAELISP